MGTGARIHCSETRISEGSTVDLANRTQLHCVNDDSCRPEHHSWGSHPYHWSLEHCFERSWPDYAPGRAFHGSRSRSSSSTMGRSPFPASEAYSASRAASSCSLRGRRTDYRFASLASQCIGRESAPPQTVTVRSLQGCHSS